MTLTVLAGSANMPLADAIAAELGVTPRQRLVLRFADTELHVLIEESVRGHDVYLIQPTSPPVDEHIVELLFLADACRRAGARRLTAVTPYFGYARQDRRAKGREPIGARVAADLIEGAGFDRVVAIDLHTPAIEGFFRLPLEHLSAASILAEAIRPSIARHSVVVAPDMGAAKLAERYQGLLNVPTMVVLRKTRLSGHEVSVGGMIGDGVRERAPLIVDDMITTGATIEAAVKGPPRRRLPAGDHSRGDARAVCGTRTRTVTRLADPPDDDHKQRRGCISIAVPDREPGADGSPRRSPG